MVREALFSLDPIEIGFEKAWVINLLVWFIRFVQKHVELKLTKTISSHKGTKFWNTYKVDYFKICLLDTVRITAVLEYLLQKEIKLPYSSCFRSSFHIFIVFLITRIFLDPLYRLSGCRSSIRPNFQWHTFSEAIAGVAKVYRESYSPRWDYTQRHLSTAPSSVRCLYNSKYLGIFSRLGWEARWDIQRWCFIRNYQSDRKLLGSFYWLCRVRFWN